MKTIKIILLMIFAFTTLNSCKYECPCFDKSLLTWIPQEYGDEIKFFNQNNDTIIFVVIQKIYTDNYKIERQNKKSCEAYAELIAENDTLKYSVTITQPYDYNTSIGGKVKINSTTYCNFVFSFSNINSLTENLEVNNKNYTALVFENDTTINDNEIYKIILAENYGLLKFYEKSGTEWTLIEE